MSPTRVRVSKRLEGFFVFVFIGLFFLMMKPEERKLTGNESSPLNWVVTIKERIVEIHTKGLKWIDRMFAWEELK